MEFPISWVVIDALVALAGIVAFASGIFFIVAILFFVRPPTTNNDSRRRMSIICDGTTSFQTASQTTATPTSTTTTSTSLIRNSILPIHINRCNSLTTSGGPSPPPASTTSPIKNISSWNLYLIFLLIPDALINGVFGCFMFIEAFTHGSSNQRAVCNVRTLFNHFYLPANLMANAVVAHEIYRLAYFSHRRQKTSPPKLRTVLCQMAAVYLYALFLSLWSVVNLSWSPNHYQDSNNFCVRGNGSPPTKTTNPDDGSSSSSQKISLVTSAVASIVYLLPIVYVFYVAFRIWKGGLLPIKGQTRALAIYFFRVVFVFAIFFVPMITFGFTLYDSNGRENKNKHQDEDDGDDEVVVDKNWKTSQFVLYSLYHTLVPLQSIVTLRLTMFKDDIAHAIRDARIFSLYPCNRSSSSCCCCFGGCNGQQVGDLGDGDRRPAEGEECDDAKWEADDVYEDNSIDEVTTKADTVMPSTNNNAGDSLSSNFLAGEAISNHSHDDDNIMMLQHIPELVEQQEEQEQADGDQEQADGDHDNRE